MGSSIPSRTLIQHIYLHIPFCLTKCGYCSFYSVPYHSEKVRNYLDILHKETKLYQDILNLVPKTIYFGGGTPSLLNPHDIQKILACFDLSECEEVTLEMNPITVTESYLKALVKTSVNRISLGVQSFVDTELKFLGRRHTSTQISPKVQLLRDYGYHNISLDMMYGLPNQTTEEVQVSLESMLTLKPEHISTYCLSIEDKTAFYENGVKALDEDQVADIYDLIRKSLMDNGYVHYEISNFGKSGFESKHNLAYWDGNEYLGLGAGAAGFIDGVRYQNDEDMDKYEYDVVSKTIFPGGIEEKPADLEKEYIFMNLRKATGIDLSIYHARFSSDFMQKYKQVIDKYAKMNLLLIHQDSVKISPDAYFISNEILNEFM